MKILEHELERLYLTKTRTSPLYFVGDDMNLISDESEMAAFDSMWIEGLSLWDIAKAFDRDPDEIVFMVVDRKRKGFIEDRHNGFYGRRMPDAAYQ